MLTAVRPYRPHDPDTQVAVRVLRLRQRTAFEWSQFLIAWCSAFHLAAGLVLLLAPYSLVLTEGTRPVLDIAPRQVWGLLFVAIGGAVAYLLKPRSASLQVVVWLGLLALGGMWLTAFGLAVLDGEGSALGVVVWPFLYGPWALVAVRRSLGKR